VPSEIVTGSTQIIAATDAGSKAISMRANHRYRIGGIANLPRVGNAFRLAGDDAKLRSEATLTIVVICVKQPSRLRACRYRRVQWGSQEWGGGHEHTHGKCAHDYEEQAPPTS